MTVAVVVLSVLCVFLVLTINVQLSAARRDAEAWRAERRELINRVVAKHTGEVLALDRDTEPRPTREPHERILVEGLS